MSEIFKSNIERVDRKIALELGEKALVFSYLNSKLYEHPEEYRQFDHVYRVDDVQGSGTFYLREDAPHLYELLDTHNFPKQFEPYPSPQDEAVIMQYYDTKLHQGIDEMLNREI